MSILPWWPAFAQELQKLVRKCVKRFAVHPGPDLALCIAVPEGHGLGEVSQLLGSNEGGSREGREEKNAREGTCLAPSQGMQERENTSKPETKNAVRGEGIKSARNAKSKLRLRKSEPTTESK